MSTLEQIQAAYETFVEENEKFVSKGNKAAAGRAGAGGKRSSSGNRTPFPRGTRENFPVRASPSA